MAVAKPTILYVDDEENNLNGFRAAFRQDYIVHLAGSAKEAIEILDKEPIQIIITDQRMPDITGVEFLSAIIDTHPDPIRMLITGYDDIEPVIQSINKGQVYRYISKPWEQHNLKIDIDNAYEIYITRNQLKQKNAELAKAYNELDKFDYSTSHDLRAPLMSILGIVQVAKLESNVPATDEYLSMIEKSVHRMDVFVQNIMNYYRNTRIDEYYNEIHFERLLRETINDFEYFQQTTNIFFKTKVDQTEKFWTDEGRLRIILNNLISNAIKYQKNANGQLVSVSIEVNEGTAKIEIEDNGIGIEIDHINNIFDMFYVASHENAGSGIGLYIVKEAVNKITGTIKVYSQSGVGTKFNIVIPNKKNEVLAVAKT